MEPTCYSELISSINRKESVILRTDYSDYFYDSVDAIVYLSKLFNVLIITFDTNTRDLIESVDFRKGDILKLRVIDAVSIISGRGTPPLRNLIAIYRPTDFNDLQVYAGLFVRQLNYKNVVVLVLSIDRLEKYENRDEIGVFMFSLKDQFQRNKIPCIYMLHTSMGILTAELISRYSDKIIPVRKMGIYVG